MFQPIRCYIYVTEELFQPSNLSCVENQATIYPGVLFEFKPTGLIHKGAGKGICQAKAKIELVVTENPNQEG